MIYISTAMYHEAKPIISHLGLKRDNNIKAFQVFRNDEVVLIISGVGMIPSSISTTFLLTQYKVKPTDLFLNAGVCGTTDREVKIGDVFLCHKIINHDSKRIFYPDMLFKHPFKEGVLESFSKVVTKDMIASIQGDLVDMEGAGTYEAASRFLPPHQINCIKIVSDYLEVRDIKPKEISDIINKSLGLVVEWVQNRHRSIIVKDDVLTEEERYIIKRVSEKLKLSVTMEHQFLQLTQQYKIREDNLMDTLKPLLSVECDSKREGKNYFGKLKKQLMEF